MSHNVSRARAAIKQSLWEIVNPSPQNFGEMINHFRERCAYCETTIEDARRHRFFDQLEALDNSARKSIGNYVLACDVCRTDRQRFANWSEYLHSEFGRHERFKNRKRKIEEWITKHADEQGSLDPKTVEQVKVSTRMVIDQLEKIAQQLQTNQKTRTTKFTEEESEKISQMIARAEPEKFAKNGVVAFLWDTYPRAVVQKAAESDGFTFEDFMKDQAYRGAVKVLKSKMHGGLEK